MINNQTDLHLNSCQLSDNTSDFDNQLVSIIVPIYNAEKYLSETIQSVVNQTYKNWELILVDDCSEDNSYEIAQQFSKVDTNIGVQGGQTR